MNSLKTPLVIDKKYITKFTSHYRKFILCSDKKHYKKSIKQIVISIQYLETFLIYKDNSLASHS